MIAKVNKVLLVGHALDEPHLRCHLPGKELVQFELVTESVKPGASRHEGLHESQQLFVKAYGNNAKQIAKTLHKGTFVFVEGQLRTLPEKLQGRYFTEVVLEDFMVIAHKRFETLRQ